MLEFLFNKVASPQGCNFIKKKLQQRCFKGKFAKFLRKLILKTICKQVLLTMLSKYSWDNIAQETFSTGAMLAQTTYRSSHQRCSVKKCVLKNFTLFTGKHLCWSLSLIKLQGLQPSNFIKKRLQHRSFPVNNVKFLRTPILKSICEQLLLLIVIFSQENNHIQCWHELPEPKLHKKLTCVMLVHSPKTTHRKIIYNFVWIYQGRSNHPEVFLEILQSSQECLRPEI